MCTGLYKLISKFVYNGIILLIIQIIEIFVNFGNHSMEKKIYK